MSFVSHFLRRGRESLTRVNAGAFANASGCLSTCSGFATAETRPLISVSLASAEQHRRRAFHNRATLDLMSPSSSSSPSPSPSAAAAATTRHHANHVHTDVSPAAYVHPNAWLGEGVSVGPFCMVGPDAAIGDGCELLGHNIVMGHTILGANNTLRHGAIIGSEDPGSTIIGDGNTIGHHAVVGACGQDLKYVPGTDCFLRIGNNNDIREFVSIHRSSHPDFETIVGDGNMLMGSCHVAHDVCLGDNNIIGNNSVFAGHVSIGDHVRVAGACGVQPRVVLGSYSYLTGGSMVDRDVPPFTVVQGDRAEVRGLNEVLMRRCGFSLEDKAAIRVAFQELWQQDPGCHYTLQDRAQQLLMDPRFHSQPKAHMLLAFICDSFSQGKEDGRVGGTCKMIRSHINRRSATKKHMSHHIASS